VNALDELLARIAGGDARDELECALGWTVVVRHEDMPENILGLYGFQEPAAAMSWASANQAELNEEPGEDGFRCVVLPIMPAL
jgi:hypothetical protein